MQRLTLHRAICQRSNSLNPPRVFHMVSVRDTIFIVPVRYQSLEMIGVGSQGVVCSATDIELKRRVAIKKIIRPFQNATRAKQAYRELKLLATVKHKNILGLLDVFSSQITLESFTEFYLVTEHMDASLYKVIEVGCDHEHLSFLMYQLLCAVKHLHSAGIVHRNLRPLGVMVNSDCTLKLTDMGLARKTEPNRDMTLYVASRSYRAPELMLGMQYDEKVDVWSVGCIMTEIVKGRALFSAKDDVDHWTIMCCYFGAPSDDFLQKLDRSLHGYVAEFRSFRGIPVEQLFPDEDFSDTATNENLNSKHARDLLSKMLVIDPAKRLSVEQALQHPYIRFWYEEHEANALAPAAYDDAFETQNLTASDLRGMIFDEIKAFEPLRDRYDI